MKNGWLTNIHGRVRFGEEISTKQLLPVAFSFRLINPQWEELIRHVLVEDEAAFQATSSYGDDGLADADLLDKCEEGLLTDPFPQFICPLMRMHSMSQTNPKGPLNSTFVEPYNHAVDRQNHPCTHSHGQSCVILFLPLNRILFGCAQLDGDVLVAPAQFNHTFVVSHQLVDKLECELDSYGDPVCSTESVFVHGLIVQEEHSCCCRTSHCAVLYFDQGTTILPFIRMIIDVEDIVQDVEERKRKKREAEWRPLANSSGSLTTDIVMGGGLFCFLLIFMALMWLVQPSQDTQDMMEGVAYGLDNDEIERIINPPRQRQASHQDTPVQ